MAEEIRTGRAAAKELRAEAVALRAAAKGAFAEARALVPWYQRRSTWIFGIAVLGLSAAAAGSGIPSTTDTTVPAVESTSTVVSTTVETTTSMPVPPNADTTLAPVTDDSVSKGFGSQDASADVKLISCGVSDALGFRYPKVLVTNGSSKTSSYLITIAFESQDGRTKYEDSTVIVNSLKSNQSTTEEGFPVSDVPKSAVCKVTEVQRTAT